MYLTMDVQCLEQIISQWSCLLQLEHLFCRSGTSENRLQRDATLISRRGCVAVVRTALSDTRQISFPSCLMMGIQLLTCQS